jgi:hypothetical protein
MMTKKSWLKGALIVMSTGTLLGFQGCLGAVIQRILVAVMFD